MIEIKEKKVNPQLCYEFRFIQKDTLYEDNSGRLFWVCEDEYIILYDDWSFITGLISDIEHCVDFPVKIANKEIVINNA